MALIRWEPFREVESLQKEMNRLFDRLTVMSVAAFSLALGTALVHIYKLDFPLYTLHVSQLV